MHKYASAEERVMKNQKMTVCHFGFTEKCTDFRFQQHRNNTRPRSLKVRLLPLLVSIVIVYIYIYICINTHTGLV